MCEFTVNSDEFKECLAEYRARAVDRPHIAPALFMSIVCVGCLAFVGSRSVGLVLSGFLIAHLARWLSIRHEAISGSMLAFDGIWGGLAHYRIDSDGIWSKTSSGEVHSNWSAFIVAKHWGDTWAVFDGRRRALLFPAAKIPVEVQELFRSHVVPLAKRAIRCKSCGYWLRGLRGNRCPECGMTFFTRGLPASAEPGRSADRPIK